MIRRALVIWFALAVLAVANGGLRERTLIPQIGAQAGHVVSTVILCAGILVVTYLTISWIRPLTRRQAIAVGLVWLTLTLGFEFGFGYYVVGVPVKELLADYDVLNGRVWVLVLATTAVAPFMTARARGV